MKDYFIIKGLKEIPSCPRCPCFRDSTMDGPAYCALLALIYNDYFHLPFPDPSKCPIKKVSVD